MRLEARGSSPRTPTSTLAEYIEIKDDFNDQWGKGIQIRTGPLHFVLEYPVMMVALLEFIREWGVTDATCRWRMVYDKIEQRHDINPLELLILLDEEKQMDIWGRYGGFKRRSHVEHMRAELRTNRYWHDNFQVWFFNPWRHLAMDRGYSVDFLGFKETGRLAFDIVQGHHYEHRQNEMGLLAIDINDAIRQSVTHSAREDTMVMASAFYTQNTRQKHAEARWKPPMD